MDVGKFEQEILKLAFETNVRITTASVAYYLGMPSSEVGPKLEELLEQGVLELDSDEEGNLYYQVPDTVREDSDKMPRLRRERLTGVDGEAIEQERVDQERQLEGPSPEPDLSESSLPMTSVDQEGSEGEPLAPRAGRESTPGRGGESAEGRVDRGAEAGDEMSYAGDIGEVGDGERRSKSDATVSHRQAGRADSGRRNAWRDEPEPEPSAGQSRAGGATSGHVQTRQDDYFDGITQRQAEMDASLDQCGGPSVVVRTEARCEPRPLAESGPTLASCTSGSDSWSTSLTSPDSNDAEVQFFENRSRSRRQAMTASSSSGAAALYQDEHLEQPEHQPGMSLLLSLILCGTGQIYNGEVSKGIMMMVLCFLLWFVLLGWVVHIWSIVDSVVVAERINRQSNQQPSRN